MIGDLVKARNDGIRLHRFPGLAQGFPYTLPKGGTAVVTAGPTAANDEQFFGIESPTHATGWVRQDDIALRVSRHVSLSPTSIAVAKTTTISLRGFPGSSTVALDRDGASIGSRAN